MPLVVDRYELGPIGTNCYVVRAERGAQESVVIDPGADAAALRLELARMGTRCAGILVFANSVGRVDLPGGDWNTLLASVRNLADRFPPETVIYPGHGPETTLGAELARNPFLAELRAS